QASRSILSYLSRPSRSLRRRGPRLQTRNPSLHPAIKLGEVEMLRVVMGERNAAIDVCVEAGHHPLPQARAGEHVEQAEGQIVAIGEARHGPDSVVFRRTVGVGAARLQVLDVQEASARRLAN